MVFAVTIQVCSCNSWVPVLQELGELRSSCGAESQKLQQYLAISKQTVVCLNTFEHSTLICTLPYSCIKIDKIMSKEGGSPAIDPQTHIDKCKFKCKYKQPEFHLKLNPQARWENLNCEDLPTGKTVCWNCSTPLSDKDVWIAVKHAV